MLRRLLATRNDTAMLILRLALAAVIFPHGAQKMLGWFGGHGFQATLSGLSQTFPVVLAVLAILAEFLGSLGLFFGFLTRIAAFGVGVNMLVAIMTVHWHNGFFMNWTGQQAGEGFEFHILAIGLALTLITSGGGRWSMDYEIVHQMDRQHSRVEASREAAPAAR